MPRSLRLPFEREARSKAVQPRASAWRIAFVSLAIAFAAAQFLDFMTAQGLSSIEPRGYFAEANPLLAQIADPLTRQFVGFGLKVALVIFVVWIARLQRRRAIGASILLLGIMAGLFGAESNMNPW
ncbi:MAG: hypothetical protein M3R57_00430 [Chloroflexota bacterium]|nr:hypothetical protein [Chloroflexota bacterium]